MKIDYREYYLIAHANARAGIHCKKMNSEGHYLVVISVANYSDGHYILPQISLPGSDRHYLFFTVI